LNGFPDLYVYGYDGKPDPAKRARKEGDLGLTADERSKRHKFYEDHKEEIIDLYEKLHHNAKATAKELTARWKVDAPITTIYGLLVTWKVLKAKKVKKVKKVKGARAKVITRSGVKGEVVNLKKVADGVEATIVFTAGADLHLGQIEVEFE
jgi:hypothetical protein